MVITLPLKICKNYSKKLFRYHRAFIEASNEYLEDYLKYGKHDELIQNVIDYFTEKWNSHEKSFTFKKKSKIQDLMIQFPNFVENKGGIEFKSVRNTASQVLENSGRFNKRKLNEFLFVVEKLKDGKVCFEMMKKHLYNQSNEESFFNVYQKYAFKGYPYYGKIFSANGDLKLVLPAAYYNHLKILKWLKEEQQMDFSAKNHTENNRLHLGKIEIHYIFTLKIKRKTI